MRPAERHDPSFLTGFRNNQRIPLNPLQVLFCEFRPPVIAGTGIAAIDHIKCVIKVNCKCLLGPIVSGHELRDLLPVCPRILRIDAHEYYRQGCGFMAISDEGGRATIGCGTGREGLNLHLQLSYWVRRVVDEYDVAVQIGRLVAFCKVVPHTPRIQKQPKNGY